MYANAAVKIYQLIGQKIVSKKEGKIPKTLLRCKQTKYIMPIVVAVLNSQILFK